MSELTDGFQSLPPDYQHVLRLAQERHQIRIAPLQVLVGGWSGAMVYLASVTHLSTQRVEHFILKLDRKSKASRPDERARHAAAVSRSPAGFADNHLATLALDGVEAEGAVAIFYSIAGQSLQEFRPLSSYTWQDQLELIFAATYRVLLEKWNPYPAFAQALHPRDLLDTWLGFRLKAGAPVESFLRQTCRVDPNRPGFLIQGNVFPNPLWYARQREGWDDARPIDALLGLQHGDLNTSNILVRFSTDGRELAGYYLIDFALFKEGMPLFYDLRYLEAAYLLLIMSKASLAGTVDLILHLGERIVPDPSRAPVEMAGASAILATARRSFESWVSEHHPSLRDDLWGQYWLAGAAAGLNFSHKAAQADEQRLAGLIFAAVNLRRFFDAFSLPLPTDVEQLYNHGQFGTGPPGRPPAGKPHHNLPVQPTPFIGRAPQIAAIRDLLLDPQVRLVSLLGPGGTGKSRLSLEVARGVIENFPHGVFFVPLADDTDAEQLVLRIAQQLEVREGGRPLLENVKDYLRDACLLLVLDNFEQLVFAAPILTNLLAAAPQLKILVSSRVALQLSVEHEFPVPPLELPETAEEPVVEELAGNESVLLFIERARAVQPGFALTRDNAPAVAEICRRLDGLPLALELAAARVKLLTPQAILARLDDRLKLLTGGSRDLPARHQTLRNTLEWSYSLLDDQEKTLYARLGVFVGGFTLEAAEAVCNPERNFDILEGLTSLSNNSLLRQEDSTDGEPRFGMLETIRAYALERLRQSGEMDSLQRRHAEYFGNVILNQAEMQLYSARALHWLNWLEREHDNVRQTLHWSLTAEQGIELGAGLVFALHWFWYRRGHFIEGRVWAEQMLASPTIHTVPPLHALALQTSGMMALWQGRQETALSQLQQSLEIRQRLEEDFMLAAAQMTSAIAFINMGRDADAQPLLETALRAFREHNQTYFQVLTLVHLGNAELGLGYLDRAQAYHMEAETIARTIGENWIISFALNNLGEVARTRGEYDRARTYYEECEALLQDTGDRGDLARFAHSLGYIAQHEGDYELAEAQFRRSLAMFRRLGNRRGMAECMAGLAGLKARQGQALWGAVMLSAAESVLKITGGAWWPADRVEVEANQAFLRSVLSEAELDESQRKGRAMTLEQALMFASKGP